MESKLTVIGGSGVYTPLLFDAIIKQEAEVGLDEICLNGRTAPKLEKVATLCQNLIAQSTVDLEVNYTTDRAEALRGADYVLTQIRVGGMEARAHDEEFPLQYDIIGEETVGPGGFANAFRTVPVMLKIAREIEEYAPEALVINLTNPASIVQQALNRETDLEVVSVCDLPVDVQSKMAAVLGAAASALTVDYHGLNHLGWYTGIYLAGENKIETVLAAAEELDLGIDPDLIRNLGVIPVPYLKYYYHHRREVAKAQNKDELRARELLASQEAITEALAEDKTRIPEIIYERGAIWYSAVIVPFLTALNQEQEQRFILNISNQGLIPHLDEEVVVEVPAVVNSAGIKPLQASETPRALKGLLQTEANYRQLATEAAVSQCREAAVQALLANPLVSSLQVARDIVDNQL